MEFKVNEVKDWIVVPGKEAVKNSESYEQYCLQWMICNKHSLSELIEKIASVAEKELSRGGRNDLIVEEAFEIFESEVGFSNSEIWLSKDEYEKIKKDV